MHGGGGNCLKYLKKRWNRKEVMGYKDFKNGGQAESSGGCLKKVGGGGGGRGGGGGGGGRGNAGTPIRTMICFFPNIH